MLSLGTEYSFPFFAEDLQILTALSLVSNGQGHSTLGSQCVFEGAQLTQLVQLVTAGCQEIGLVAFMFFFELLLFYVSFAISFYVSFTNLFSIILFPYLLITRDTQDKGEARFRFY